MSEDRKLRSCCGDPFTESLTNLADEQISCHKLFTHFPICLGGCAGIKQSAYQSSFAGTSCCFCCYIQSTCNTLSHLFQSLNAVASKPGRLLGQGTGKWQENRPREKKQPGEAQTEALCVLQLSLWVSNYVSATLTTHLFIHTGVWETSIRQTSHAEGQSLTAHDGVLIEVTELSRVR